MDRKSRQEIKKYILVFLAFFLCLSVSFFIYAEGGKNKRRYQITELTGLYPEMEADIIRIMEKSEVSGSRENKKAAEELDKEAEEIQNRLVEKYGYAYYRSIMENRIWKLYGICILSVGAVLTVLWLISGRKKEGSGIYLGKLKQLDEILTGFSRGNHKSSEKEFQDFQKESGRKDAAGMEETEVWMKIEESIQELGMYLENVKERYGSEEEKTKALITNISHQLKTPLASLRMSHELAVSDYLTKEEKQEFLMREEREIAKLQLLLDEMTKLSRLEKHMIQLKPRLISLKDTISDAVSMIYPKALTKSMSVQVEMEEDIIISHDAHWTAEAFTNILDNAVKYAPAETEITIRVRRLTNHVLIEIMDEGPGISDQEKHKIYQRFYRGEHSGETEGAGVGLYLARQILEEQKGSILVKNNYPAGSIFQILLPT